jgi:hypothetical protein
MKYYLLILLLFLTGCAVDPADSMWPAPRPIVKDDTHHDSVAREWRRHPKDGILGEQWDLVCPATGRLDGGQVTLDKSEQIWHVWSQGANVGEFAQKSEAIAQAERVVKGRVAANLIEACEVPK